MQCWYLLSSLKALNDRTHSPTAMTPNAVSISHGRSAALLYSVDPLHQVVLQVRWYSVSVAQLTSTEVGWHSCVVYLSRRYVQPRRPHIRPSRTLRRNTIWGIPRSRLITAFRLVLHRHTQTQGIQVILRHIY